MPITFALFFASPPGRLFGEPGAGGVHDQTHVRRDTVESAGRKSDTGRVRQAPQETHSLPYR